MAEFTKEQLINLARENVRVLKQAAMQHKVQPVIAMDLRLAEIALAALKAGMEQEPVSGAPELSKVLYHFRDWNEGFPVERFKADYVIGWMLENYPPAPQLPQPAVVPSNELLSAIEEVLRISDRDHEAWHRARKGIADFRAAMLQGAEPVSQHPELTVWYGSMPETNRKSNWTAVLHRKGQHPWGGITIDCSEYPDRVRYEADRMRHLIGELSDEPDILAYDADAHSGYVEPVSHPYTLRNGWVAVPVEPTPEMQSAAAVAIRFDTTPINKLWTGNAVYKAMIAAAPQQEVE